MKGRLQAPLPMPLNTGTMVIKYVTYYSQVWQFVVMDERKIILEVVAFMIIKTSLSYKLYKFPQYA